MELMELYQPQLAYGGKVFQPGVYDISNEEYHASAGISRSAISLLKKSPLHYWQQYLSEFKEPFTATPAMIIGEAIHTLIMEPHLFDERFVVGQQVDGRTKEGKKYKEEFAILSAGKRVLCEDQYNSIINIMDAVNNHPIVRKLIKDPKIEQSIYWVDSASEILCKARPDIWTEKRLIDIKTTADATPEGFSRSVSDYNYHIQAAMQIDAIREITGVLMHHFVFIAIQTSRPYKPYIYTLGDYEIELGRKEYKKLLIVLHECFESKRWDLDRETVIELNLPAYAFNKPSIDRMLDIYGIQV
jgi:hypothetical protein